MLVGSITDLKPSNRKQHVVAGSHCGVATGILAANIGVASLICHDASAGMDNAGVAGLSMLDDWGIPAATVSHLSARIGDPHHICSHGLISFVNARSRALGIDEGMKTADAMQIFKKAPAPHHRARTDTFSGFRTQVYLLEGNTQIHLLDSASALCEQQHDEIVVTGSHAGLPNADSARALKTRVRFIAFNDAGVGLERAGIARLGPIGTLGIPAVAVDAMTARIGDGLSTLESGKISFANGPAMDLGTTIGMAITDAIKLIPQSPKPQNYIAQKRK